jgi:hypothetical protein
MPSCDGCTPVIVKFPPASVVVQVEGDDRRQTEAAARFPSVTESSRLPVTEKPPAAPLLEPELEEDDEEPELEPLEPPELELPELDAPDELLPPLEPEALEPPPSPVSSGGCEEPPQAAAVRTAIA